MRRYLLGALVLTLIGAAGTIGLGYNKDSKISSFTITILSGCSIAIDSGDYNFGSIPAWTAGTYTRDIVLRAWTNTNQYEINAQATAVQWDGGTPSAITLNNFSYTGVSGIQQLTSAPGAPAWFSAAWTGDYQMHHALLTLSLTGNEAPGTYTTTVTFTMTATP